MALVIINVSSPSSLQLLAIIFSIFVASYNQKDIYLSADLLVAE